MAFRFVHTADWQIGRPFRGFGERMAGKLEEARLGIVERVAEVARLQGAKHILVAGDTFDAEGLPRLELRRLLERLAAHAGLDWLLLPGNHDPARPGGLWHRVAGIGLPANVTALVEPAPMELAPGVVLLPAPLKGRVLASDPTAWMDRAVTADGAIRIGLAHGSIQDFGIEGESSVRLDPARATSAGLAYLALGDWHGTTRVNDRTWYSGTPEPDRFPENEPGHVLAVEIDQSAALPRVQRISTAHYTWAKHAAVIAAEADLASIDRHIAELEATPGRLLLQLGLSGSLSIDARTALDDWIETLEARVAFLQADLDALHVRSSTEEIAELAQEGELQWTAERLVAMAADRADSRGTPAEAALIELFRIVRAVGKETAP